MSGAATEGDSIGFIGGGNMAGAILGALLQSGWRPPDVVVVEHDAGARELLFAPADQTPALARSPASIACAV